MSYWHILPTDPASVIVGEALDRVPGVPAQVSPWGPGQRVWIDRAWFIIQDRPGGGWDYRASDGERWPAGHTVSPRDAVLTVADWAREQMEEVER